MGPRQLTTGEAAARLETTKPTIVSLIARGELKAHREPHGKRDWWIVDEDSVDAFLARRGTIHQRRRVRAEHADPGKDASKRSSATKSHELVERERDHLRAQLVALGEVVARQRTAAELQREADEQRAVVVDHLLKALHAAERTDDLRRRALSEIDEAVAGMTRAGHLGDL